MLILSFDKVYASRRTVGFTCWRAGVDSLREQDSAGA